VDALGVGVDGLHEGQPVMAMTAFPQGQGGYAEYTVVDAALVAALPHGVDLVDAASIPLAAGTALEVLKLLHPAGSSVLVLGASGGVGLYLVQLAAAAGLRVVGVGRERSHALMRELGAIGCVDYTQPDAMDRAAEVAGGSFDAVADLVGGPTIRDAQPHLRDDGLIVAIATPELDIDQMIDANQTFHGVLIRDDGDRTRELADLYGTGRLRTHVTHRLPFEQVAEAHRLLDSGEAAGKVVLAP
jgi:NADPH:quinone reductase